MNTQKAAPMTSYPPPGPSEPRRISENDLLIVMRTDANVLLTASPSAALALALRVHRESGWRYGPFTVVDCTKTAGLEERLYRALDIDGEEQASSELRLIQAGTVLLQEIGAVPHEIQSRLADRLGEIRTRSRSRRRVLASTSEPLLTRVLSGSFDDRLFYRLNLIHLKLLDLHRPAHAS